MSAAAAIRQDADSFPSSYFEDNLAALDLTWETKRDLSLATARGKIVCTADRTPLIEVDGKLLGAPLSDDEIRSIARQAKDKSVFVVFGVGMGHVARALREASPLPILIYEPDPGILRTVLEQGPTDLGSAHVITSLHDLMPNWVRIGVDHLEAVIVRTPGYGEAYKDELLAVPAALHDIFQRIGITRNTYDVRARVWVEDILENLSSIVGTVPFLALANKYENVPAFIVGAGPSLDKNVLLVAEAAKKGIVFCVNSSSRALARHGIVPHVVACIESIDSSKLLAELPFIDDVVRAISLAAAPNIMRTGRGPLLPVHEALPQFEGPLRELMGVSGAAVCGSVSTAAFSLAHKLGCSPIVFLGQDLAYTSGRTHAGGTWWEDSRATVSKETGVVELEWSETLKKIGHRHDTEQMVEVPAWGGKGTVFSGVSFTGILSFLESAAPMMKSERPSLELVNATEGGAHIEGFEERTLADVLATLPELGITPASLAQAAREARAPLTRDRVASWADNQAELGGRARRAARRLRKCGVHARGAVRSQDTRAVFNAFAALDEAEAAMRAVVSAAPLLDLFAHAKIGETSDVDEEASLGRDTRADAERAIEKGIELATVVERSAAEFVKRVREMAERVRRDDPPV